MKTWRYTDGGQVRHLLRESTDTAAVCGTGQLLADWWLGAGSQAERDRVNSLPECKNCVGRA